MRTRVPFPTGIAEVHAGWSIDSFAWGLWLADWVPDESVEVFVADIAGTEMADGSYTRQPATTKTVDVDLPAAPGDVGYVKYLCDDVDFGVLSDATAATWLVLIAVGSDDSDSAIVAALAVNYVADGAESAAFTMPPTGAHAVATTCTGVF